MGKATRKIALRLAKNQSPEWHLKMYEGALAAAIAKFGPDSGPAARGRGEVALQLESMDRFNEARLLREEIFDAHRRNLGDDDEETLVAEAWLALNMMKFGLRVEANEHFRHVYEVRLRTLGPEHELTQWTGRWLASTDSDGDFDR